MSKDLDVTEVLDAVERVQRAYRKPLPGTELQQTDGASIREEQQQAGSHTNQGSMSQPR
jgi:hypothetical protein